MAKKFEMSLIDDETIKVNEDGHLYVVNSGGSVDYAERAGTAEHADTAGTASYAGSATEAEHAISADTAISADMATSAYSADSAAEATHAQSADTASEADRANTAENATEAEHAAKADHATVADTATSAESATEADHAQTATLAEGVEESAVDNKTIKLDQSNKLYAVVEDAKVDLGGNVGSATNPIFLDGDELRASDANVGSGARPIFMEDGVLKRCEGTSDPFLSIPTYWALQLVDGELQNVNCGSEEQPVYFESGQPQAVLTTCGSESVPVYLKEGKAYPVSTTENPIEFIPTMTVQEDTDSGATDTTITIPGIVCSETGTVKQVIPYSFTLSYMARDNGACRRVELQDDELERLHWFYSAYIDNETLYDYSMGATMYFTPICNSTDYLADIVIELAGSSEANEDAADLLSLDLNENPLSLEVDKRDLYISSLEFYEMPSGSVTSSGRFSLTWRARGTFTSKAQAIIL